MLLDLTIIVPVSKRFLPNPGRRIGSFSSRCSCLGGRVPEDG